MSFHKLLNDLTCRHNEFLKVLIRTLQCNDHPFSAVPSAIFLLFILYVLHLIVQKSAHHRRITYRDRLCREIGFQWFYLYVIRCWFYAVKGFRLTSNYLEQLVINSGGTKTNVFLLHLVLTTVYCIISVTPLIITIINLMQELQTHEILIMWIPANRWTRGELGTAGRLMEHPPDNLTFPEQDERKYSRAYHTKRSNSTECSSLERNDQYIRFCKSVYFRQPVSSFREIVANNNNDDDD